MTAVLGVKHKSDCSQMLNNESLLGSNDFRKLAYTILIERHASLPQRNQSKWKSDFQAHGAEMIDWSKSYSLPFLWTRESKLQIFQFKILYRRISTNSYLFKIGLISSELCSFCESSTETLLHLFWECPQVKIFWNEDFMFGICGRRFRSPLPPRPFNKQISHFLGKINAPLPLT